MQVQGGTRLFTPGVSGPYSAAASHVPEPEAAPQAAPALFKGWPGPMAWAKPAVKAIVSATDARAEACEAAGLPGHALIWRLLGVMSKHKGAVRGSQPEGEISKLLSAELGQGAGSPDAEDTAQRINAWVSHDTCASTVRKIEGLLVSGMKHDALRSAKDAKVSASMLQLSIAVSCFASPQELVQHTETRWGMATCTQPLRFWLG